MGHPEERKNEREGEKGRKNQDRRAIGSVISLGDI